MIRATETTLTLFIIYLYPLKLKSCAGHISHTVFANLIIFGGDIYQVKAKCHMQEKKLLLCSFFSYLS